MSAFHCDFALLPEGWRRNVRLTVGADGRWDSVTCDSAAEGARSLGRCVIPGMPNLHSHAFQRAMAGSAERFGRPDDSFWSWRELMYRFAGTIDPDSLYAIAAWLYVEMLERGYTRVCEFHYVHHQADGTPHADPAAMSAALIAAARDTGIGLTLLPTLYQRGGFKDEPLAPRQRRFEHALDAFGAQLEGLVAREQAGLRLGVAIHSLRAVAAPALQTLLAAPLLQRRPIHIHVAEQRREVEDCVAVHGRRPIAFLYDQVGVDARYCLVHATHTDASERERMHMSGAVAGLCPTTEANLGDGLFPIQKWRERGGRFGIGSDSQIGLDPREELRWLEYQARLASGRRTVLADAAKPDVAENLWTAAVSGGAQACGAAGAGFSVGADADWIAIDADEPALAGHDVETLFPAWLFGPSRAALSVGVGGVERVSSDRHPQRERFAQGYRAAQARLREAFG
jgi:formimidoylglutamate deiminase